jgi:hypothetical protein
MCADLSPAEAQAARAHRPRDASLVLVVLGLLMWTPLVFAAGAYWGIKPAPLTHDRWLLHSWSDVTITYAEAKHVQERTGKWPTAAAELYPGEPEWSDPKAMRLRIDSNEWFLVRGVYVRTHIPDGAPPDLIVAFVPPLRTEATTICAAIRLDGEATPLQAYDRSVHHLGPRVEGVSITYP